MAPDAVGQTAESDAPDRGRILFFEEPCERLSGSDCTRCAVVCPAGAISFGEDGLPRIDDAACTRCGICVGMCDSFSSSLVTTYDFAKRLQRRAEEHEAVYLCCREDVFEGLNPAENVTVVPCLASLPPELVAYLLAHGVPLVLAHDLSYCEDCPAGGRFGGRLWQRSFELAQQWTGCDLRTCDEIPEEEGFVEKMAVPDRRSLFTNAIAAAGDVASGRYRARKANAVEDFLARREKMRATAAANAKERRFIDEAARESSREGRHPRKRLLREAVAADPSIAERIPGYEGAAAGEAAEEGHTDD